jgi:bifunctional enzyme CysN/CysC
MVTGASTADVAIILIDARKGVLEQTKRHSFLTSLVGIKKVVIAVNKMDLINYDQDKYKAIINTYKDFARKLNFDSIYDIPISALNGDNVLNSTKNLSWFKGPSLMSLLETINIEDIDSEFIMPVQNVIRPDLDYRAFCGRVSSGIIKKGQKIRSLPSGKVAKVESINIGHKIVKKALKNQSVSITLDAEIDISRGDVLCKDDAPIEVSNIFDVNLAWLSEAEAFKGRNYIAKIGTQKISCQISNIKYKFDINSLEHIPTKKLQLNDICNATITLNREIPYTNFNQNQSLGKLILIDPISNQTVAAAMINHSMRRASNIHKHDLTITRELRENLNGIKAKILWFTGISGSGKSTIANELEKELFSRGIRTFILDGDNVRHGLNSDLGFDNADRVENIRRVGEVAKLMLEAGIVVISSFISPFISDREMVKKLIGGQDFVEIFINTPLEVAENRDPKGLYKKARSGSIPNFTGISSPYENPESPDIEIDTTKTSPKDSARKILEFFESL